MSYTAPNYGPITDPGQTRRRIWRGQEENPLSGDVFIKYHEQQVDGVNKDGELVQDIKAGEQWTLLIKPTAEFLSATITPRDPITDAVIPDATYQAICMAGRGNWVARYSLGRWAQEQRDVYKTQYELNQSDPEVAVYGLNPSTGIYTPAPE